MCKTARYYVCRCPAPKENPETRRLLRPMVDDSMKEAGLLFILNLKEIFTNCLLLTKKMNVFPTGNVMF